MQVTIWTPSGEVSILAMVRIEGRTMFVDKAHVGGPGRGALGRAGLDAIGAELLSEADVDDVVIRGSPRTTGRNPGRAPRAIRYPGQA